jgi:hypothetical protein
LAVVEIESGITRGCEKVSTWITVDGEMSTPVGTDLNRVWDSLKVSTEGRDVFIGEE